MNYPIIWIHPDGRRIEVYSDRKIRSGYPRQDRGSGDDWRILYRRDVPALTNDQWHEAPGPDWTEA